MKRYYLPLRRFQPYIIWILFCILTFSLLFLQAREPSASANFLSNNRPAITLPMKLQLDSHLPVVAYDAQPNTTNVNGKFGSRFDFVISPGKNGVQSGTDGLFHDNSASYSVGIAPVWRTYNLHIPYGHCQCLAGRHIPTTSALDVRIRYKPLGG